MSSHATSVPCYLVEWYDPRMATEPIEHTAARLDDYAVSMSTPDSTVRLLTVLAVPADDVCFGVFTAASADLVAETCQRAGLPAQRLTPAVDAHFGTPES
ncbi:hypothetical protein TUM20985_52020 [Mycobacterium antarcticum]|uniref:hypothetical protein n=1 Tax=unclassified Mycolicibacterium TaxID=2636767 RepID=UPI002394DEE0|nr:MULTISPECIES: hypothetical protein [unclassified Mycolicibacterium]BDX34655.1 hypothetical protein TUM20985_52020 [Mycolicibacterium sp. TUM20985]GLP81741.1 hypothetical protein TUM20984_31610 [Mycolicibacterium sp. TUM20984]